MLDALAAFTRAFRLAERFGRVSIKVARYSSQQTATHWRSFVAWLWPAPAPLGEPGSGVNPRLLRVVVFLFVANAGLVVFLLSLLFRASRSPDPPAAVVVAAAPASSPTPPSPPPIPSITINLITATAGPSPTPPQDPFSGGGTLAYALRAHGHTNLWALRLDGSRPQRLTAGPWDDRDPAWSPDGGRLAFASRRDGNWELYVLDIQTGETTRLTHGQAYEGRPSWSPDGLWLTYEGYAEGNLNIYIISASGEGEPILLTSDPAADHSPVWSPGGRQIAFVSTRSGNPDLFLLGLDTADERQAVNLTNSPTAFEADPAWSPNGEWLAFTDRRSPLDLIYTIPVAAASGARPVAAAQGRRPAWSPAGATLVGALSEADHDYLAASPVGVIETSPAVLSVPGRVQGITWTSATLPALTADSLQRAALAVDAPLWSETITRPGPPYTLIPLADVVAPWAALSDRVDESFIGLRDRVRAEIGWDFLGLLDDAALDLEAVREPGLPADDWHKAGRAFDVSQAAVGAGWVEVVREEVGAQTLWRLFLRTRLQDGAQGEPLRDIPWDFSARYSGRPEPYDAGGEYRRTIPPGYYVDFTALAADYGWHRIPASDNWRSYYPGAQYWEFQHRGGLTWAEAMLELYSPEAAFTPTPVPGATPLPTPTQIPTRRPSPTPLAAQTLTPAQPPEAAPASTPTPGVAAGAGGAP